MIYALYGSDTYQSRKKLRSIIAAYREKAGASFDLHRVDAGEQDVSHLKSVVDTQSLFSPKKLVVVEYAFCENLASLLPHAALFQTAKDRHLILWDGILDAAAKKRVKEWEPFFTRSQEFSEFKDNQRMRWIQAEAVERGISLSPAELNNLAQNGGDSWSLVQDIEKRAVSGGKNSLMGATSSPTVFDLGDRFFMKDRSSFGILHHLLEKGQDEFEIFSYLASRSRSLIAVKICEEMRQPIPSWLGIHPFVAKKTSAQARALTVSQCISFLPRFFEEDMKIKIGLSQPKDSILNMLIR